MAARRIGFKVGPSIIQAHCKPGRAKQDSLSYSKMFPSETMIVFLKSFSLIQTKPLANAMKVLQTRIYKSVVTSDVKFKTLMLKLFVFKSGNKQEGFELNLTCGHRL